MLHGSMESSSSHLQLAQELADVATVYLPDRRGRGLSGPYRADDGLAEEVQDVQALMAATGARHLFGVSSGAVICLQTALTTPGVDKVAVFEPAMIVDGSISTGTVRPLRPGDGGGQGVGGAGHRNAGGADGTGRLPVRPSPGAGKAHHDGDGQRGQEGHRR